ncbi:helix-turn-helix domain-containing protein [Schaalia naturae]|uniref:Helix-turn-helix domain-containing protein n=1 Tax=Schaalia naturae TaxID=635203 RepID=A0ABW2SN56_9ACTO
MNTNTTIARDFLSVDEAAAIFGVSSKTVRRMISRGELRAKKFGTLIRISRTDLDRAGRPVTSLATVGGE